MLRYMPSCSAFQGGGWSHGIISSTCCVCCKAARADSSKEGRSESKTSSKCRRYPRQSLPLEDTQAEACQWQGCHSICFVQSVRWHKEEEQAIGAIAGQCGGNCRRSCEGFGGEFEPGGNYWRWGIEAAQWGQRQWGFRICWLNSQLAMNHQAKGCGASGLAGWTLSLPHRKYRWTDFQEQKRMSMALHVHVFLHSVLQINLSSDIISLFGQIDTGLPMDTMMQLRRGSAPLCSQCFAVVSQTFCAVHLSVDWIINYCMTSVRSIKTQIMITWSHPPQIHLVWERLLVAKNNLHRYPIRHIMWFHLDVTTLVADSTVQVFNRPFLVVFCNGLSSRLGIFGRDVGASGALGAQRALRLSDP